MPALTQAARDYETQIQSARNFEAAKKQIEYENAVLTKQEKERETPEAKIALAEDMAIRMEALKQKQQGIEFGDVAKQAALGQGMSLLEASKQQGAADIQNRMLEARGQAMQNILMGGKGLVPTEQYKYQGVSGTALSGQGAAQLSNARRNVFQADYNDFYDMYLHAGQSPQVAHENAVTAAGQKQMKADSSGKVTVMLPNFGSLTTTPEKLNKLYNAPDTPEPVRNAIGTQWAGEQKKASGSDWVRNKLGY